MKTSVILIGGLVCFLMVFSAGVALAGEPITLTGTVTDSYQLSADDGESYYIADTVKGEALLENVGKTVKVTGSVTEEEGFPEITVQSFSVVEE